MTGGLPPGSTIAHLIETDGPGGAERVVVHLVSRLAARGFHNVVLLPQQGEGWLAKQLPQEGVSVVPVPLMGVPLVASFRAVRDVLRAHRPSVAHSHEFTMSALGGAAAWRLGVPHVFTMHGGRYYATRFHRRLALALAARASAVVAVSQTVATQLAGDLRLARTRIHVIPNGIPDVPLVQPGLRQELRLPADAHLIVTVGNLYEVKGHADLVQALALVQTDVPRPVHVAIAGRGPEETALRQLAQSLDVANRLHLLGLRNDVANVLRSGELFVLPSHSEGLPLALLEAMRAGLPIIATAVGEVPIVLRDGEAGLLVQPGDVAGLATGLRRLLNDPREARALAARGTAIAAEAYDSDRMTDRYVGLYGEMREPRRLAASITTR